VVTAITEGTRNNIGTVSSVLYAVLAYVISGEPIGGCGPVDDGELKLEVEGQ
jgi:hypothetical protein